MLIKKSERIKFIDVFKGIGILLVIVHHCTNVAGGYIPIGKFILSFHMPLFFFASGFLYSRKESWNSYFSSKVKGLIIPYVLYLMINSCIVIFLFALNKEEHVDNLQLGGFWFIVALFYVEIIYYFIDAATIKCGKICGGGLALLISAELMILGLIYSKNIDGGGTIVQAEVGMFFFAVGREIKRYFAKIRKWMAFNKVLTFIFGCVLLVATFFLSRINSDIFMYINSYGNSGLFVTCALMGIFGIFCISYVIGRSKILEFYGQNSLVILVTHFTVRTIVGYIISLITPNYTLIRLPIVILIVVSIETLIVLFVNKYVKWFKGDFNVLKRTL